jgi:hypothetical protein
LKFGMFIYEPTPVEGFDLQVYRLKSERGIVGTPNPEMTTNIACFGDNNMAAKHPDWVQMSKDGPALRTNKKYNFRWDIVCNREKQMVDRMLDMIEDTAEKTKGITLSSMHYADHGFCTCPRCKEAYEKSGLDWLEWRAQTVTDFIKSAKERVKNKPFYVGLLPDAVNSYERFGFDFDALAEYVRGPGDDPNEVEKPAQIIKTACRIARTGVDGLIFLAGNATIMKDFQKAAVENVKLREELEGYGGKPVLDLIDRWESIIQ